MTTGENGVLGVARFTLCSPREEMMIDAWEVNDMGFVSSGLCIVALHYSIYLHCLFGRCMFFGLA